MQAFTLLMALTILFFVDLWLYAAVHDGDTAAFIPWIGWINVGVGLILLGLTVREIREQFRRHDPLRGGLVTGLGLLLLAVAVGLLVLWRWYGRG